MSETDTPEIEITEAMIEAGIKALVESGRLDTDYATSPDRILALEVFSAMYQLLRVQNFFI